MILRITSIFHSEKNRSSLYYLDATNQKLDKNGWRWFTHCVEKLPKPKTDEEAKKPFEILVEYLLLTTAGEKKLQSAFFEQLIDALAYELYFPEELHTAGKEFQAHIGALTPLANNMPKAQKHAIIQQAFDHLSDPAHLIPQRLLTLDEVEVVRKIRAALKR